MEHVTQKINTTKTITVLGLFIWLLAALFFLYEFFSRTFIGTLASGVMHHLHISAFELSIIGAAYYIAYAGMQIPIGIMIDRWGVKRLLVIAALICTLGIYLFAHAHSFTALLTSRCLMGLGSSFAFVSLLVLALNWFPSKSFGFFSGATQVLGALGPILAGAPLIAILSLTHNNWRLVLTYIAIFGILLAILILLFLQNHPKKFQPKTRPSYQDSTPHNLKLLLQNRQARWIAVYAFCSYASISLLGAIWGTYYLETQGIHRDHAANITSMIWLGLAIGSPVVGYISDKIGNRKLPLAICTLIGVFVSGMIAFYPDNSILMYFILYFCLGFVGAGQTLSFACLSGHVSHHQRATAMGLNNTAVMLGGVLTPPLVGLAVQLEAHGALHHSAMIYTRHDFILGLSIMPILYLVGTVIAFWKIKEA